METLHKTLGLHFSVLFGSWERDDSKNVIVDSLLSSLYVFLNDTKD